MPDDPGQSQPAVLLLRCSLSALDKINFTPKILMVFAGYPVQHGQHGMGLIKKFAK
jgi:hypothetical protein